MILQLTKQERADLLREILTGKIDTDKFKRIFNEREAQPIFCTCNDEDVVGNCEKCRNGSVISKGVRPTDEELKRDVKELLRKCDGLL